MKKMYWLILLVLFISLNAQIRLVEKESLWKYYDEEAYPGNNWFYNHFDDSDWKTGKGELGYGDGDEQTVLNYGNNNKKKYPTYYFRKEFSNKRFDNFEYLYINVKFDDSVVLYLNGREIERKNLPKTEISHETLATEGMAGISEDKYEKTYFSKDLLSKLNTVAAEVHQRSLSSSDISFDLEIVATNTPPELVNKEPYLIYAGKGDYQLIWQLNRKYKAELEYGHNPNELQNKKLINEYNQNYQYSYLFSQPENNKKIFYEIEIADKLYRGSFVPYHSSSNKLKFLAYGDTRSYPESHDSVAKQILKTMEKDPEYQSILVAVGDLVYDGDEKRDWKYQFFDKKFRNIQTMLSSLPLMSCKGNHERDGKLFRDYFPYPYEMENSYYWSYDYGPVHFTYIDQYVDYSPGSEQFKWLVNDLKNTKNEWKIIVLHEPGWSAGGHGNEKAVQKYIQPLCLKYDVSVVLAGHNHYYARAEVDEVQHVTTGGGGAPLRNPNPQKDNVVKAAKTLHFCKFNIKNDILLFKAVDNNGLVIDFFKIKKEN